MKFGRTSGHGQRALRDAKAAAEATNSISDAMARGNFAAIVISIASGLVSVAAFAMAMFAAARGSEVTLLPISTVTLYRTPEGGRLGLSLRPEYVNTSGPEQGDALISHYVTVAFGEREACFADRFEARLVRAIAPTRANPGANPECAATECFAMADGSVLVLRESSERQTLPGGEIVGSERYFDTRDVTGALACQELNVGPPPTIAELVGDFSPRTMRIGYRGETLRDGTLESQCRLDLGEHQLRKLDEASWAEFECVRE